MFTGMEANPQVLALEAQARAAKLRMTHVLADAGVDFSTWHRWRKGGTDPKLSTLQRVEAAIKAAVAK